jgi:hypothetical protein
MTKPHNLDENGRADLILSIHQPAYLPWLGYFDKILRSDIFVYMDNVQFERNSFINRNRIKTPQGAIWLTVPVKLKGHTGKTIQETEIDNSKNWRKDHLSTIFFNYKKARNFSVLYPELEKLYAKEYVSVSALCFDQLLFWLAWLGIKKEIIKASELGLTAEKSDLVLEICEKLSATKYLSGALGRDYLELGKFKLAGIEIELQEYKQPVYEQLWGEFIPNLSILDYCLNAGDPKSISNS